MFKVGDKVYLREDSRWNNGFTANPLNTVGTVDEDNEDDYGVMWSNGIHNSAYTNYDLMLATEETSEDILWMEVDPLVEILQSEYTSLIEEINLLQELLAEANIKLAKLDFKPVTEYTLEDWEQAVYNNWMFEQRNGDIVTVNALDDADETTYPVDTDNAWLTLSGREYLNAQSAFDILRRIE